MEALKLALVRRLLAPLPLTLRLAENVEELGLLLLKRLVATLPFAMLSADDFANAKLRSRTS